MTVAFFDTNIFGHILERSNGVTDDVIDRLRTATTSGTLVIPASLFVTEELVATAKGDAKKAKDLGALYLEFARLERAVKEPKELLADAAIAYGARSGPKNPYLLLSKGERDVWRALSSGEVERADVLEIITEAKEQVDDFLRTMESGWEEFREAFRKLKRSGGKTPTTLDLWPGLAPSFLRELVERTGALKAVRRRGLKGLLGQRCVRASVGYFVSLIHAQVTTGKKPDVGDSRDLFHVTTAAAVGEILVTHDGPFATNVGKIPDLRLEVLSLPELMKRF